MKPIGPRWTIQGKISRPKEHQNAAFEKNRDRIGESSLRATRGAHHSPWWKAHDRACPVLRRLFCFPSCLFGFSRVFSCFAFKCWCIWTPLGAPNTQFLPIHPPFIFIFRVVLERVGGRRRRLARRRWIGQESRDQAQPTNWASLYLSLLFSQSNYLCFVVLIWICSFNLGFMQF